ncbi:MAG: YIP1 family protein [Deltaproteobacteria bacterium]|nr:YIP1 family protein [Deltaproteobacteria bacterium]
MATINCAKCFKNFNTVSDNFKLSGEGEKVESTICPHCGHDNKKSIDEENLADRAHVKERVHEEQATKELEPIQNQSQSQQSSDNQNTNSRRFCSWEKNWNKDFIGSYIETTKGVLTSPIEYFSNLKPFDDFVPLAIYIFINVFISTLAAVAMQIMLTLFGAPEEVFAVIIGLVCWGLVLPFVGTAVFFLFGFILHLFMRFIGGSQKGFETTMTVYGLSSAANLFGIIPFVGGFIAFVYSFVINIGGQAKAHQISFGSAILAVFLPLFICCCCFFGFFFLVGGAATLGTFMQEFANQMPR